MDKNNNSFLKYLRQMQVTDTYTFCDMDMKVIPSFHKGLSQLLYDDIDMLIAPLCNETWDYFL